MRLYLRRSGVAIWPLAIALLLPACQNRIEHFVLPEGLRAGWVAVELSPRCPPPRSSIGGTEFEVGPDGYACYGAALNTNLVYRRYFQREPGGGRHAVNTESSIHNVATLQLSSKGCEVLAISFWFGPAHAAPTGQAGELLRARHPECR